MFAPAVLAANLLRADGFPFSLDFTNPGAETGDTTGWTQTLGANFGVNTSSPHSGTYRFVLSSDAAFAEVAADAINVPAAAEADIDAGAVKVTFTLWRNDFASDDDYGIGRLEFYAGANGTGTFLGCYTTDTWNEVNGTWTETTNNWRVPPGTRSMRLYIYGGRLAGTELSFYFDDVQPLVLSKDGNFCDRIYSARGGDGSGWTVVTGSGQPPSTSSWSDWGWAGIYGGSQAAYAIYKDVLVSSLSAAAQAAIAAGDATLHLHRYAWNENDDDESRTRVICRSTVDLATVQDAAATTDWNTLLNKLQDATVAVPAGTTSFRVRHDFTRVDGTVLDAQVAFMHVWITW